MTKFWPVSTMLESPALTTEQKLELVNFRSCGISEQTMQVCQVLTRNYQGMDITMLYTEGTPLQRVYLKRPPEINFLRLERNVFIDTGASFGFNVAPLQ